MSDQYEAFRAFARAEIRAQRLEFKAELVKEIREELKIIEGPPGKDGRDGRGISAVNIIDGGMLSVGYTDGESHLAGRVVGLDGKDGSPGIGEKGERGADGINGKDGAPSTQPGPKGDTGERGADGIATRAELDEMLETRFAELQVRSLADVFEGVYDHSKLYPAGRIAVLDGQSWLSMTETRAQPGVSSDWKLLAKKGRDGRDRSK